MNKPLRQSPGVHPGWVSMCATQSSICLAVLCVHVPETAGLAALHELPTLQIAAPARADTCIAASLNSTTSTTSSWYSCQSCNAYQLQGPWRHGRPDSLAYEAVGQLFVHIPHWRRIWRLRVSWAVIPWWRREHAGFMMASLQRFVHCWPLPHIHGTYGSKNRCLSCIPHACMPRLRKKGNKTTWFQPGLRMQREGAMALVSECSETRTAKLPMCGNRPMVMTSWWRAPYVQAQVDAGAYVPVHLFHGRMFHACRWCHPTNYMSLHFLRHTPTPATATAALATSCELSIAWAGAVVYEVELWSQSRAIWAAKSHVCTLSALPWSCELLVIIWSLNAHGLRGERWEGEGDDGFMVLSQNCYIMLVLGSNHAGIKVFSSLDSVLISLHLKPYIVLW